MGEELGQGLDDGHAGTGDQQEGVGGKLAGLLPQRASLRRAALRGILHAGG